MSVGVGWAYTGCASEAGVRFLPKIPGADHLGMATSLIELPLQGSGLLEAFVES